MARLRLLMLAVLSAALAGCLLLPGKFDSALDLRRDGTFHFHYAGELVFLPLAQAASRNGNGAAGPKVRCADRKPDVPRCTSSEIADEQRPHPLIQAAPPLIQAAPPAAPHQPDPRAMMTAFGGGTMTDAAFADALRRQAGWRKVESRGNGVFDVEFDVAGRLDHDFTFPTLEHTPLITSLVSVTRRADGSVRVEAPGFASLTALGSMLQTGGTEQNALKGLPGTDGLFTLTTDGTILANNTEDGPSPAPAGAMGLTWKVTSVRATAPTALIRTH